MTHLNQATRAKLAIMAGIVGIMSLAGSANAGVIYYSDTVTFREAKRMCAGIHGRVFLSERDVYACQGDKGRRRAYIPPPPPPPPPGDEEPPLLLFSVAGDPPGKAQNFKGADLSNGFGRTGGGSGGGNGGGGNGRK